MRDVLFGIPIFVVALLSCSETQNLHKAPIIDDNQSVHSVEVSLARASIGSVDFEHYKVQNSHIFYECGEVQGGQYLPKMQEIELLSDNQLDHLRSSVNELLRVYSASSMKLPKEGSARSFTDPGILTVTVTRGESRDEFKTNIDDTVNESSTVLSKINDVVKVVRGLPKKIPCDANVFYGLSRAQINDR